MTIEDGPNKRGISIDIDTVYQIFYYSALTIFLSYSVLNSSMYSAYLSSGSHEAYAVCCLLLMGAGISKITKLKWDANLVFTVLILVVLEVLQVLVRFDLAFTTMWLLVLMSVGTSFEKTAKISLSVLSVVLLFIILSSEIGIIKNISWQNGNRVRQMLGFGTALRPSKVMLNITWLVLYLNRRKVSLLSACILTLLNYVIYELTVSRLNFYIALLSIIIVYFFQNRKVLKHITAIAPIWPCVCALLSLFATLKYDYTNQMQFNLNSFLESRLSLGQSNIVTYGIGWLGSKSFKMNGIGYDASGNSLLGIGSVYNYVDNLYVQYLIQYGILFMIIILAVLFIVPVRLKKNDKSKVILTLFMLMAIVSIVDDGMLKLQYNIFMLLAVEVMFGKSNNSYYDKDVE